MEDQKKHIDDLFRQQLNDYQEAPRAGVWDRIEDSLDKIDTANKPGNKKPGGSRGLMGYSIVLLLLAVAAFFIFKQSHKQSLQSAANSKVITVNNSATIKDGETNDNRLKELNNADKTTRATTNNTAAGQKQTAVKSASINTSNKAATKNTKRIHIASHTANRVAGRKTHHTIRSNNSVNNNKIVATEQQSNNDKANVETNTKDKAIRPSAHTSIAKVVATKSNTSNNAKHISKQENNVIEEHAITEHVASTKKSKLFNPEKTKSEKAKNTASTEHNNIDQTAVTPSASLPGLKKAENKTDASIAKKKSEKIQVKKEIINTNKIAENENNPKRNTAANSDKKLVAAEKKTELPVNNSSAILPESKPITANKSETKEILKQKAEDNKPEEQTKNTADTNIATNNAKENTAAAAGGSGPDDIAHQSPTVFNLQAGVKLGYEQGFSQYTTSKFLGAVYAQVGLSDKFAILLQPAIKYTQLNKDINYGSTSYYNNTGIAKSYRSLDSADSLRSYVYYGTYDSIIVKKQNTTTSYIGFEVPVMVKYKFSNSFSILGGVNIDISNLFVIGENKNTIHLTTTPDSMILHRYEVTPFFDTLKYRHAGTPYSAYIPVASGTQTTVRLGYMLGVDYSLADKFTLEFLVTQSLSGYNNISDKNIKSLYAQPYFRLSIGYRFLNITRKKPLYNGGL